jgi:hypothetical protein
MEEAIGLSAEEMLANVKKEIDKGEGTLVQSELIIRKAICLGSRR